MKANLAHWMTEEKGKMQTNHNISNPTQRLIEKSRAQKRKFCERRPNYKRDSIPFCKQAVRWISNYEIPLSRKTAPVGREKELI